MRFWLSFWLAVSLFTLSNSLGTARAAVADTPNYPIGAGDVLQITTYAGGEEQDSFTSVVSASGKITTPLLGEISIVGLLPSGVSQLLEKRLAAGYYVNPQVIVGVKEYAGKVYVLGEVQRPGAYNVRDGLTALNACILAGGFSDYAALNRVKVIRQSNVYKLNLGKVRKGKDPDMVLRPGDRIEVPHRRF
jgi:polysaccharide export outer membrane protein